MDEYEDIDLSISILSMPVPMSFSPEADLISKLCPGIDGLILADRKNRGAFLPQVWQHCPEAPVFLQHLRTKAGFEPQYWADNLRVWPYTTEFFSPAV